MRFQIGDKVATTVSTGVFERGQLGIVKDVLNGEVLFQSADGPTQWLADGNFELVHDTPEIEGPGAMIAVLTALAVVVVAAVLICIGHAIAGFCGVRQ